MNKFFSIECFRAVLAWWVVFGHAMHLSGYFKDIENRFLAELMSPGTAVCLFIIISGFVITHLILSKNEIFFPYIIKRAFRIYPIYLFCLLIAILTTHGFATIYSNQWLENTDKITERIASQQENFWTHLTLHLSLLHGLVPDSVLSFSSSSFLGPAWSLTLEWQFYLIAPLIVRMLGKSSIHAFIVSSFLLISSKLFSIRFAANWDFMSFIFLCFPYFMVGISSRFLLNHDKSKSYKFTWILILLGSFSILNIKLVILWILMFGIIILEQWSPKGKYANLRRVVLSPTRMKFLQDLGKCSYSTYLVHIPLFSLLGFYQMFNYHQLSQEIFTIILIALVLITYPLSLFLYKKIEMPLIKIGGIVANKLN
jgi:peptidoglycan/LPS O-acetylase OafA/YrhL